METKRFAGLDGLRFLSIVFVVLHHLFTFKNYYGIKDFNFPILGIIGLYGIHFFFMGSGFLITYLLVSEFQLKKKINIKSFYLRRILRIWPAYYLLIIISLLFAINNEFFNIPGITDSYLNGNFKIGNLLYFLFLPHLVPFFISTAPLIHQTYTIGMEEQFYLVWGIIFFFFYKYAYRFIIFIILITPILNYIHIQLFQFTQTNDSSIILILIKKTLFYFKYSKFSTFAIGSFFGYAYFFQRKWIFHFKKKSVQIIIYVVIILSIVSNLEIPYLQFEYMSLLMACVMLMATFKENSIINYSNRWIESFGKISYGIYLFHIFAIVIAIRLLEFLGLQFDTFPQVILLSVLTLALSILFGWFSYFGFEIFFLRLKHRFKRI